MRRKLIASQLIYLVPFGEINLVALIKHPFADFCPIDTHASKLIFLPVSDVATTVYFSFVKLIGNDIVTLKASTTEPLS